MPTGVKGRRRVVGLPPIRDWQTGKLNGKAAHINLFHIADQACSLMLLDSSGKPLYEPEKKRARTLVPNHWLQRKACTRMSRNASNLRRLPGKTLSEGVRVNDMSPIGDGGNGGCNGLQAIRPLARPYPPHC